MTIFFDYKILNFQSKNSIEIISELKKLVTKEVLIITQINKVDDLALKVYNSEGVFFNEGEVAEVNIALSENKLYLFNNIEFNTLSELLKSIKEINRTAILERKTNETKIKIKIDLDGKGKNEIDTGIGFFDHMLQQISRHANIDLFIKVDGDIFVDYHHTVEDTGLALGESILLALGKKTGIKRYGYFLPMDESIAKVAIDLGGRAYLNFKCKFNNNKVGKFPTELTEEFFKSVAAGMKANIYIKCKGKNDHHKIENIFKGFAKSLNEAFRYDCRSTGILPSTKGVL